MRPVSPFSITPVESTASLSKHVQQHFAAKRRINFKFLGKLKKSDSKTIQILTEAYGDETLPRVHVPSSLFNIRLKRVSSNNSNQDLSVSPEKSPSMPTTEEASIWVKVNCRHLRQVDDPYTEEEVGA
ncbi:hypothetical protein TNCV_2374771 [Trichonephila clavipes]|nr:hypothetical protein TNCV_2374771 [Trichonephila clavipes]